MSLHYLLSELRLISFVEIQGGAEMLLNYRRERNFYIQQSSIHKPSTLPSFNMLSLDHWLFALLFLSSLTGVSCEELTPVKNEEFTLEDSNVTLSYTYSRQATGSDYFFWYRQYPGKPPEFIISHSVSDSAVYYCAVKPNTGGRDKLIFGRGTSLTIEPNHDYQPSIYSLSGEETTVCLATGFSRYHALNNSEYGDIFNNTVAARISEDSLYSQAALLLPEEAQKCEKVVTGDSCEGILERAEKVNLVSLTVLALRLIFLKTVVFNVLLTLRIWISQ